MPDRQKIIKELEHVRQTDFDMSEPTKNAIDNALALLKEQKSVEPIYIENPYTHLPVSYCSKCREPISKFITGNPYKETEYCHYCGQAVKWK